MEELRLILTVVGGYVSESDMYNNAFVHARVKVYLQEGVDARVFWLTNRKTPSTYLIEGVSVTVGRHKDLLEFIDQNDVEALCFHFFDTKMIGVLDDIARPFPVFIFVHGNEALMWYERIFPGRLSGVIPFLKFAKYVMVNTYSIQKIRKFLKHTKHNVQIVCVSEWMKKKMMENWRVPDGQNIHIIPNVINDRVFKYYEKDPEQRFNLLMIRNFSHGKYAPDQAIKVIQSLSKYEVFSSMKIRIIGRGRLFKKYTSLLSDYPNVEVNHGFMSQRRVAEIHKDYGLFLCPTRQDAQGVSMCEAMSSGLIPITSLNTAIPEFVPMKYGLACKSVDEMVDKILEIIYNPELFKEISAECSRFIQKKCSLQNTTEREIRLISELAKV